MDWPQSSQPANSILFRQAAPEVYQFVLIQITSIHSPMLHTSTKYNGSGSSSPNQVCQEQ